MLLRPQTFLNARLLSSALVLLTVVLSFSSCAKRSRAYRDLAEANDQQSTPTKASNQPRINLNTASVNELETLPGIGKGLAARIIEHREKWGAFRRPEHLLIVRGISDRRFRALRDLITVE